MCNSVNCTLVGIIVAILVGIAVGFLFFFGFLPFVLTAVFISLILAVLLLAFILWLSTGRTVHTTGSCLCRSLRTLLVFTLGTIALSVIALSVSLGPFSVILAILIGLGGAFASGMLLQLYCLIRCLTKRICTECRADS